MIPSLIIIICIIIITFVLIYLLSVFSFEMWIFKRSEFYYKYFYIFSRSKVEEKITFLEEHFQNEQILSFFKEDAINFYSDFFYPSNKILETKLVNLWKMKYKWRPWNWKKTQKEFEVIDDLISKNYIYLQKQNLIIEKVYDFSKRDINIFFELQELSSKIKSIYTNFGEKIPNTIQWKLENINQIIVRFKSKYNFLSPAFNKRYHKIILMYEEVLDLSINYLNYCKSLKNLKEQYNKMETLMSENKTILIGIYPILTNFMRSLKDKITFLKTNLETMELKGLDLVIIESETEINQFYERYSNCLRSYYIVEKYLEKINYIPLEIDIRNSALEFELGNKQSLAPKDFNQILMNYKTKINDFFEEFDNIQKTPLMKYTDFLATVNDFMIIFKRYIIFTNDISNSINNANKTKISINNKLSKINIDLLDCESKLKQLPISFQKKYELLVNQMSIKANQYIKKYKDNVDNLTQNDYLITANFSDNILELKTEIYSQLFLVKFIEKAIILLNKYRFDYHDLGKYIKEIEKSFLNGDINHTLRMILKVLELYNIYE